MHLSYDAGHPGDARRGETRHEGGKMTTETLVCGCQVQVDRSGVGHCWVNVNADELPANITQEIEGEIIDGGQEGCEDFIGSNGLHYRW